MRIRWRRVMRADHDAARESVWELPLAPDSIASRRTLRGKDSGARGGRQCASSVERLRARIRESSGSVQALRIQGFDDGRERLPEREVGTGIDVVVAEPIRPPRPRGENRVCVDVGNLTLGEESHQLAPHPLVDVEILRLELEDVVEPATQVDEL